MCGRFQLVVSWSTLVELYLVHGTRRSGDDADHVPHILPDPPLLPVVPRFNVCPTDRVAAVTRDPAGQRQLQVVRWGFPATWLARQGKDPWSRPLINAKGEEAGSKPTWRQAFRERRCLVPTTGFIEWRKAGGRRWPLRFAGTGPDGLLTLAGIYGDFRREGEVIRCLSLLTTDASADVVDTHDRMPVVLAPADFDTWLDPATPGDRVASLVCPAPAGTLVASPLSTAVNKVGAQGPEVMAPDWSLADLET